MKEFQEMMKEFSRDLLLTVPYFRGYEMVDWLILSVSFAGILALIKSRPLGLALLSIADLLWVAYDLYHGEYAQSLLFFAGAIAWGSLACTKLKTPQKVDAL